MSCNCLDLDISCRNFRNLILDKSFDKFLGSSGKKNAYTALSPAVPAISSSSLFSFVYLLHIELELLLNLICLTRGLTTNREDCISILKIEVHKIISVLSSLLDFSDNKLAFHSLSIHIDTVSVILLHDLLRSLLRGLHCGVFKALGVERDLELVARLNIVDGLIKAASIINEVIAVIRASKDKADSKINLQSRFAFNEEQSEAIVMMPLYKLSHTDIDVLMAERDQLHKDIDSYNALLGSEEVLNKSIISDLRAVSKAYADKEFNVLLVGIDRSTEGENQSDAAVNDGMTDMIMWLHFNNETGELKMLQIPRNIFVTTDASYSGNYQINAIAKTQGSAGYNDIGALCDYVADMLKVPIDGYVTIRLEKLVELVNILGGITVYVPQDMSYDGSSLTQGVHNLNGAAAEFFLRNRHSYANSDIGRLNTQRYFYAAIFARLRAMSVWDIAKNLPFYLSMVDTSLDASELVSVAVSLLNVSSDKILLAQVPVYMGGLKYPQNVAHPNDVVVAARQETADLLNTYYRENTGPVDASELNIKDDVLDVSGMTPTDPNVQYMATLNENVVDAVDSGNADIGISDEYSYDLPDPTPTPDAGTTDGTDAADGSSDSTDSSESDNAA